MELQMTHKHLQEVDTSTLSIEELTERLQWRAEHPAEVLRYEQEQEARKRLDQKMADARDGFLLAGGDEKDWARQEKALREEFVTGAAKEASEKARLDFQRYMARNF
jgi:hypothetical protein